MNTAVTPLVQAATEAAGRGQWDEAERLWKQVLAIDPKQPQALYSSGIHAFRRGQLTEALDLLRMAHHSAPRDPAILLSIAVVLREQGNGPAEIDAIHASLAADPYFVPALLAKANYHERNGQHRLAATSYANALKIIPHESHWPESLRSQLAHAKAQVIRYNRQLRDFLSARLGSQIDSLNASQGQRWREATSIASGMSQPYPSVCSRLLVPRLPAIPFFERRDFEWVDELESKTEAIIAEMQTAMSERSDQFKPYIAYPPGTPVNQWHELNHSSRWSSYFLWRNGESQLDAQRQCPETTRALEKVHLADIQGLCPNVMFSTLAPHTHIPPHHGETNARVLVHLPLVVPDNCLYRVGFEQRRWKVGEVLIFDDSIEHEARNDSDQLRTVLIFDIWNPLLSLDERSMFNALSAATNEFRLQ